MMDDGWVPFVALGWRGPPAFERRVIVVGPGCARVYNEAEWRDAIVVVMGG